MAFDSSFRRIVQKYKSGVKFFVKRKWVAWASLGFVVVLLFYLMSTTKTGLVPSEDTGSIFVSLDAPAGSTLAETAEIMGQVEKELKDIPQIENFNKVAGFGMGSGSGSSHGMFIVKLKHWDERKGDESSVDAISNEIYRRTAHIKNATIFVFSPPMISGYGTGNSFELYIQDRSGKGIDALSKVTDDFLAELNKRPEIKMAYTSFSSKFPQYRVDIDEAQCQRAGITTQDVINTLSGYFGSIYASNFNRFTKLYRVIIQAPSDSRNSMQSLDNIYVKTTGGMAPVSQFVKLSKTYGSESLTRFNLFSAINVQGMPADGYSSGDVINAVSEVAARTLPTGYGYEYSGSDARGGTDGRFARHRYHLLHLRTLHLSYIVRTLRESVCAYGRHHVCAVRSGRKFPLCPHVGTRKQHISPDRSHHAHRTAVQDGHPRYRVCHRTPQVGHDAHSGCHERCSRSSAPNPYDSPHDGVRHASAYVRLRRRCQRQPLARCRRGRRNGYRHGGAAVRNAGLLHRVPVC